MEYLGLGAATLNFLLMVGIFARKEDIANLRAEVAQGYVHKNDLEDIKSTLKELNRKIDRLMEEHKQ